MCRLSSRFCRYGGYGSGYGSGYGGYGGFGASPYGFGQPNPNDMSLTRQMESGTAATFQVRGRLSVYARGGRRPEENIHADLDDAALPFASSPLPSRHPRTPDDASLSPSHPSILTG